MRRVATILAVALAAAQAGPASQTRQTPTFADIYAAWDMGRYDEALARMKALLPGADEALFERMALLTGELYETTELTPDGRNPAFAGSSGLVMYETGPADAPRTRIVDASGTRVIAEIDGTSAVADAGGTRVAYLAARGARLVIRDVASGRETTVGAGAGRAEWAAWTPDGSRVLYAISDPARPGVTTLHAATPAGETSVVPSGDGLKTRPRVSADGRTLIVQVADAGAAPGRPVVRGATVVHLATGTFETIPGGADIVLSPDGTRVAAVVAVASRGGRAHLAVRASTPGAPFTALPIEAARITAPTFSPDGTKIAYQAMNAADWEIYVANIDGTSATRVTREIQHDVLPQFLGNDRLLAAMGEPRHRRSYIYDLKTGARQRLFHNNTVRTIAPEYAWAARADGTNAPGVLIGADRDGDTISTARGVYLVHLSRRVTREALSARIDRMLAAERGLRAFAARVTSPLAPAVRAVVDRISVSRIYGYAEALAGFDSKHISAPGNANASDYLRAAYASFGYSPDMQWVKIDGALGGQSANVVATLGGTVHPDVIYIVGSHYDSEVGVEGADDNSSGTTALLETARAMAGHPQPATIVFVSFTGEEEGLRGSRPFVARAKAARWTVAGTLNNDMIGWTNGHRLDNTIRYTNPGVRDLQHAAALTFSNLITYDARYYRGSDSQAFYDGWGALGGGIGSYPVLGSPHYHQTTDRLEIVNQQLVTEVAKTTAATLVMMSNLPSPPRGLAAAPHGGGAALTWDAAIERDVRQWAVAWTSADGQARRATVTSPRASLRSVARGTEVQVVAVNARGLEGWDRARLVVP